MTTNETLIQIMGVLSSIEIKDFIDITFVTVIIYQVIKIMRDSRAIQLLTGILFMFLIFIAAEEFELNSIRFIMTNVLQIGTIAILVVFQPEIRRALESMGRTRVNSFFSLALTAPDTDSQQHIKDSIIAISAACETLSKEKTGALVVIERESILGEIAQTGTPLDALPSEELLLNIFFHNSPLHDGAVIIRKGKIFSAGCFLPLSENYDISKQYGTRHRAALGMSESSDAIVVVVSEETGFIAVAKGGELIRKRTPEQVKAILTAELLPEENEEKAPINPFKKHKPKKPKEEEGV